MKRKKPEPEKGQKVKHRDRWTFLARFLAIIALVVLAFPLAGIILNMIQVYVEGGNLIAMIGTIELALTALFQDHIRSWLASPDLDYSIEPKPPDCHRVPWQKHRMDLCVDGVRSKADPEYAYHYRLRIENKGRASARDVEVVLMNVSQKVGKAFKPLEGFPVDHLVWAISETQQREREIYRQHITPRVPQHCSLGYIIDPKLREHDEYKETEDNPDLGIDRKTAIFHFDVYFQSTIKYYLVPPGTYRVEIMIASINAKPKKKLFELNLTGSWSTDEKEMLAKGLKIIGLK